MNEDSFLATPPLYVVADGMGGHVGGASASQAAVAAFRPFLGRSWICRDDLVRAIAEADSSITGLAIPGLPPPGTTVSGVGLSYDNESPCWLVFNIGDSRTYRFANDVFEQLTVDHSVVQQLVDAGELDPKNVRTHPERHVVTRGIGGGIPGPPPIDSWLHPAAPGDRLLVCTDGLHGVLPDATIAATLAAHPCPIVTARALIDGALTRGGPDNITVIVVDAVKVLPGVPTNRYYGPSDANATTKPRDRTIA